jgi:ribosomal protein L11 methyltransferase
MTEKTTNQDWEQVSIEVDQQLADQLAALLEEILPLGLVQEKVYHDLFPHELDQYQGPVRLYGYYPSENSQDILNKITTLFERSGQGSLINRLKYSPLENQNWATAWQSRYQPIPIGKSLIIVPTWLKNPDPKRIPLWMDPGMAFGSGTHPTTQISLALLEKSLLKSIPREMIDVGCGSGILTIAAVKLGVNKALGLDIDPDAIQISSANAQTNGVSDAATFRKGSIKDFLAQKERKEGAFLVVANIIAPILKNLFDEGLGNLVLPGGKMILSGILNEQLPGILLCLEQDGFELDEIIEQEGWVGLIADKGSTG